MAGVIESINSKGLRGEPVFDWIRKTFLQSHERRQFFDFVDQLNAQSIGGKPKPATRILGKLPVPSRSVAICDIGDWGANTFGDLADDVMGKATRYCAISVLDSVCAPFE